MACKQRLCKTCNESGTYLNHAKHDPLFQKKGIHGIMAFTWVLAAGRIKEFNKNNAQ